MTQHSPHICFLAPNAFPLLANDAKAQFVGGAELQQVIIARGLVQRGYRVSMICLDFGQEDKCEIDGIIVHRAFKQGGGLPLLRFVWPRLTSIWGCLRRVDADVYYHRAGSMLTGVMAAFCQRWGKTSIFAMAGEPKIRFRRDRWMYEYGIRHVDYVLVQNAAQELYFRQGIRTDCILIPNCYQPAPLPRVPASRKSVLWVGTIRKVKRPDVFLNVVEALPECCFTMVGGQSVGEGRLYQAIKHRAGQLNNVDFVGFVPYAEVDKYFDSAALFVNTSDSEGFPNTFLQAWVRSVPTVSFIDSGARLNGQPVGRLATSIEGMVESIADLLDNDTARSLMGEDCKLYVERHHDPDRVLELYEQLFRSIQVQNGHL